MEMLKLIGIVIIIVGFTLKLDVLAVVVISAIVTGLVSGFDFGQILEILGKSFVNTRVMSIFLLSLPVIAILERYGLKERSAALILKIKKSTAGKVLGLYVVIRTVAAALSLRLGGHVQFIRPLIYPMAAAAGETSKGKALSEEQDVDLRALAASIENYGNFFGQNVFVGAAGAILIQKTMQAAGYAVELTSIALWSIPIAITATIFSVIQIRQFNNKILKED